MIQKSYVLLIIFWGLSTSLSFAQNLTAGVNAGFELSLPIGDFSDISSVGLGTTWFYEHPVKNKIIIVGGLGYTQWLLKDDLNDNFRWSMIPLQGGTKYYVTPKVYLQGLIGLHIFRATLKIGDIKESESETEFGLGLGGGIALNERTDLSGRFQIIDDLNFFSLRLGYRF